MKVVTELNHGDTAARRHQVISINFVSWCLCVSVLQNSCPCFLRRNLSNFDCHKFLAQLTKKVLLVKIIYAIQGYHS